MNSRGLILLTICLLAAGVVGCRDGRATKEDRIFDDQALDFFSKLDTEALRMLAAQFGGRKSGALDSVAYDAVARITGSEKPDGVESAVAYLEFYFNTGQYLSKPVIFVRSRQLRTIVAGNLKGTHLEVFQRTNRIPPVTIMLGSGDTVMALASQNDFVRDMVMAGRITLEDAQSARPIGTLGDRWTRLLDRKNFRVLLGRLSGRYEAFLSIELRLLPGEGPDWPAASESLVPSDQHKHSAGCELMVNLRDAWKKRDASGVNAVTARISQTGAAASDDYPKASRLRWELFYNDAHKGHPAFAGFVVAFLLFIVAIATERRWVRNSAMAIMTLSTVVIGGAWVLRWIVGGEAWYLPPMMTQYGALISSAVLAAVLAIVIELFRKYNYIALAASFYAAAILVWVYFGNTLFPGTVDSSVSSVRGILKDPLMIIHVSVIVVGHALAGMTVVTSVAYVAIAYFRGLEGKWPSSPPGLFGPVGDSALASADRCNVILAQAACWTLIAGTLLGALWADYAWSRWWGWDPKETWALITCLFFLAVLHARLVTPSKYRGLLTAAICILGGLAMLFNWFVVNYVFSGLHSYG
ncbi:MAG: cytochrome c biogenesis protein CcsA [Phycisphaerae bacterium]|nr:cytochrome c biogenesis protein CcsA [Phycisphaerae bacterium]